MSIQILVIFLVFHNIDAGTFFNRDHLQNGNYTEDNNT